MSDDFEGDWEYLKGLRQALVKKRGRRRDLKGQVFGRLKVVGPTGKRTRSGSAIWDCVCECGNPKQACANNLLKGKVRSCGCLYIESIHRMGSTWKPRT